MYGTTYIVPDLLLLSYFPVMLLYYTIAELLNHVMLAIWIDKLIMMM